MDKIIRSFEARKKTLSARKEKELLEIVAEGAKKVREISSNSLKIAQLRTEIEQAKTTNKISQTELKLKERELQILEKKDIYQIYQELIEQFNPQQIEQREKRKPTKVEKKKWEEIQNVYQKIKNAVRLLLFYNKSFVKYVERGYYYYGRVDHEDLTTEGVLSLLKAIEKFNPSSKNRLSTFSGYYIRQSITTFIKKNQLIPQSSGVGREKKLIYYDNAYQSDKESNTYSLMDILSDPETSNLETEKIRQQDIKKQMNNLLNALEPPKVSLVIRLIYQIAPTNLFDIYCLTTLEEREELKKIVRSSSKAKPKSLQKFLLKEPKISQIEIVQKYLAYFASLCKTSASIAILLNCSEKEIGRLKASGLEQLKKLAQERNLHLLI
ncbi:MAG: sigma-70 family RNA polymerase sigma factor [Candidatus Moeniiplasma glomeromycotorum]|nr:sigma-70 family RNA polymerase sigma factor [Candidatus Moeniiplasma glomeromycotorum]MCE8168137.1 sigma-70 family RNA polymerase sigma factor [Candidatus Moeniiplasma glomeromycotorum]MCE8169655.1 sigma-70 family RNA polymerase sigma factor [Candidatus Moeniiplasma glomeromycotorum]